MPTRTSFWLSYMRIWHRRMQSIGLPTFPHQRPCHVPTPFGIRLHLPDIVIVVDVVVSFQASGSASRPHLFGRGKGRDGARPGGNGQRRVEMPVIGWLRQDGMNWSLFSLLTIYQATTPTGRLFPPWVIRAHHHHPPGRDGGDGTVRRSHACGADYSSVPHGREGEKLLKRPTGELPPMAQPSPKGSPGASTIFSSREVGRS